MKRGIIGLLVVALLAGCNEKQGDKKEGSVPVKAEASMPVATPTTVEAKKAEEPPKAETKRLSGPVPYIKNSKSISGQLAIAEYNKGHYYESVVSIVEGYRSSIYKDNIGVATGLGWNISFQSRATNSAIVKAIGMSPADQTSIVAISGNKNPSPSLIPNTQISPEQATTAAQVMRDRNFQPIAIAALEKLGKGTWDKLKPNQQAVIAYHVYKTGNLGWPHLKADITACANSQSQADCKRAAEGFTYSYMLNGTRHYDTRSQLYMGALFQDPQAYAYLLGTKEAPADFKAMTSNSGMKIDTAKPADPQIEQQDTFTPLKEKLIEEGKSFDLNVITPEREATGTKKKGASGICGSSHDVSHCGRTAVYLS
ncbi:hypothetical protein [Burkholderia contaminans]|uniref:hypothetical protein n=1 Tax=Burkholderia contaminans TaxID=488447 RepID=UPI00158AA0E6|nr:hypothetical protein [Burkholderia contaminans]